MDRDNRSGHYDRGQSAVSSELSNTSGRVSRSRSPPPTSSLTAQKLFYHIKEEILRTVGPGYLHYESILPHIGYQVARSLASDGDIERKSTRISYNPVTSILCVTMPSIFHGSQLAWAHSQIVIAVHVTGFFTVNESDDLPLGSSDRKSQRLHTYIITNTMKIEGFDNFPNPWQNIYKEPDLYIKPIYARFPTIVFETGYSESYPQLIADKDLWFGGAPDVNVVVLIKWSKISNNRIRGFVELWRRGTPNPERIVCILL